MLYAKFWIKCKKLLNLLFERINFCYEEKLEIKCILKLLLKLLNLLFERINFYILLRGKIRDKM